MISPYNHQLWPDCNLIIFGKYSLEGAVGPLWLTFYRHRLWSMDGERHGGEHAGILSLDNLSAILSRLADKLSTTLPAPAARTHLTRNAIPNKKAAHPLR